MDSQKAFVAGFLMMSALLNSYLDSVAAFDPCVTHTSLSDASGQRSNHSLVGVDPLCDKDTASGWYIVESPAGGRMYDACPNIGSCSTIFPIWMEGSVPPNDGQIHPRNAYVHMDGDCKAMELNVEVKNCNHFIVYHLLQTPGCPMAYCFGHNAPCPNGTSSFTGWEPGCTNAPPVLDQTPAVSFDVAVKPGSNKNREVLFLCGLPDMAAISNDFHFLVRWYVNVSHVLPEVEVNRSNMPHRLHEEDWTSGATKRFGVTFRCTIRLKSPSDNQVSDLRESNSFFAGFEVLSPIMSVIEGETKQIHIRPTVPILSTLRHSFKYFLDIEVVIPTQQKMECQAQDWGTAGIATAERCGFTVQSIGYDTDWRSAWNEIYNNPAVMNITATVDGIQNDHSARIMYVKMRSSDLYLHKVWEDVTMPSVAVYVEDAQSVVRGPGTCRSANDPHMTTFDGCRYENPYRGEYILYRHTTLPVQVNAFYTDCRTVGPGQPNPSCNCGVAVKSGGDVFMIDVCPKSGFRNRIGFMSCPDHSLKIKRNGASNYVIILPTNTVVDVSGVGGTTIGSVTIRASVHDFGFTEGLCGTYNGNSDDDFVHGNAKRTFPTQCSKRSWYEQYLDPSETTEFCLSWLLPARHPSSLWNGIQHHTGETFQLFCQCRGDKFPSAADCGFHKKVEGCVAWGKDVTDKNEERCKISNFLSSTSGADSDFGDMSAPPFEYSENKFVPPSWRNGWTMESARAHCNASVLGSPAGQVCERLVNVDYDAIITECVGDILLTGDDGWVKVSKDNMLGECRARVLTVAQANDTTRPADIESYLCPSDCSGNGNCVNGVCQCNEGFSFEDCSVNTKVPPSNLAVPSDGKCDTQNRPCRGTSVYGANFLDSDTLTCKVEMLKVTLEGTEKVSETLTTGLYLNFGEVMCPFTSDQPDSRLFSASRGGRQVATLYQVSLSNDRVAYSQPVSTVAFDGRCLNCSLEPLICYLKENSCYISQQCVDAGATGHTACEICDPQRNLYDWSSKEGCPERAVEPVDQLMLKIVMPCVTVGVMLIICGLVILFIKTRKPPKRNQVTTDGTKY